MAIDTFITEACKILGAEIDRLHPVVERLKKAEALSEKIDVLDREPSVACFLEQSSLVRSFLAGLSLDCELVIKSILAIGQASRVFEGVGLSPEEQVKRARQLIEVLLPVENFYHEIGGIVGYHLTMLRFLCRPERRFDASQIKYHSPLGIDFSSPSRERDEAIFWAIERMEETCEIYPVGGAADRLRLYDPETGIPLPAAKLQFCGKTLLARLIEDLQAREYLFYKLKGEQIQIPVAMMTSKEKNNHEQILDEFEKQQWFSRPKETFSFFCQPLVPTINREGLWGMTGPMQLLLKPGGHGVIWKLARDRGVIDWFFQKGAKKAIVRQINNPVSSEDSGLLAFYGHGLKENKEFGFASCQRQVKASEGINVVVEEKKDDAYEYTLTNIEYCDFDKYDIRDEPVEEGSSYSKFPSNTNLLFVDLQAILSALDTCPIPGMLVNLKKIAYRSDRNEMKEEELARLESTMQNIADCFKSKGKGSFDLPQIAPMSSYITYNQRRKTISTTKREYAVGSSMLETPEGCFLDLLQNMRELLEEHCDFRLPDMQSRSEDFSRPSFLFSYHPALGPLYRVIGQKIRKGSLSYGSECKLDIVDCDMEHIDIEGSLWIQAHSMMGQVDPEGHLIYSNRTGKCTLKNVKVKNQGIDFTQPNVFWKNEVHRKESCRILLEGESEFYAENVTLAGDLMIRVEDGYRVTACEQQGKVSFSKEKISSPSWKWQYGFSGDKKIFLKRIEL